MSDSRDYTNLSSTVKDSVRYKRTLPEKAVSAVPGFWGHSEKEILRRSDQLVRDVLFKELNKANEILRESYSMTMEMYGKSVESNRIDRILIKNDTLMQKILHATRGYSPLMNSIKISEMSLSKLTNYDAALGKNVNALIEEASSLKELLPSKDELNKKLINIESIIDTIKNDFDQRDELLKLGE